MASVVAMPVVSRGAGTGRAPMEISRRELPLARSMCWHCQSDIGGEYFCNQCVKVQPLSKDLDYFSCFGLPRKLTIDTARLETKFYELSRVFHPDFFEGKSEMERAVSLANSATLNQAYRTLKDPILRVEYLLRLEAGAAKDIPGKAPADLFEAILEMQEHLEEFQAAKSQGDASSAARAGDLLRKARKTLEAKRAALENRLAELFQIWDKLAEKHALDETQTAAKEGTLKEMRDLLSERTYVMNMLQNLKEALV
ncbi:MAG: Fe-S protein assembly co-chaperone HscB [Nitrospirae bacterium]|nr:MAG: Fe-S protein assembly co-chaperone HscB [Nitrospirota bacterium]